MYVQTVTIGDEYHYILDCQWFSYFRNRFIISVLRVIPNILLFKQIIGVYQKQYVEKLYKFLRNIYICLFSRLCHAHVSIVYMFISMS